MSWASATFNEWGRSDLTASDGRAVRASVEVQDYVGAVRDLGPFPLTGGLVTEWAPWNAGSAADALAPILTSETTLNPYGLASVRPDLADGLQALTTLSEGSVRLRLLYNNSGTFADDSSDGAWTLGWCGFAMQEGASSVPGQRLAPTALRFHDGLRLLTDRPWLDSAPSWNPTSGSGTEERLVDALVRLLKELEGSTGGVSTLTTSTNWYPYVASDAVAATTDPMRALLLLRAALWNPETGDVADQATAVRQIVARVLGRVSQARGAWSVVQSDLLASLRGASVPTHTYDLSAHTPGSAGTRTTPSVVQSVVTASGEQGDGYQLVSGLTDWTGVPIREATSPYDFEPDLDTLIANGSFEVLGASATLAAGWTFTGDNSADQTGSLGPTRARRVEIAALTNGPSSGPPFTPTEGEKYALLLTDDRENTVRPLAVQARRLTFASPPSAVFSLAMRLYRVAATGSFNAAAQEDPARLQVWFELPGGDATLLARTTLTTNGAVTKATKARVPVTITVPSGVANSVVAAPAGATLTFTSGETLELSEPLLFGSGEAVGDLSGDVATSEVAALYYWAAPVTPGGSGLALTEGISMRGITGSAVFGEKEVLAETVMQAADGTPVGGVFRLRVVGAKLDSTDPDPATGGEEWVVDRVVPFVGLDDRNLSAAGTVASRASLPAGSTGGFIALPASGSEDHRIGDGPLPTSRSRLRVAGGSGTVYDTIQGDPGGWRESAWGGDAPPSGEGLTIDALAAKTALRLLLAHAGRGAERRVSCEILMRPTSGGTAPEPLWPDRPIRVALEGRVQLYASAGSSSLVLSRAPTPGEAVVIAASRQSAGTEETVTASTDAADLVPLIGGIEVGLSGTTAQPHYPQESAWVGFLGLPVSLSLDWGAARVQTTLTALALADPAGFLFETTLDT